MLRRATPAPTSAPTTAANRARWLLVGMYLLMGMMFSSWMARLPSVRETLGLSTAQIGEVLLVASLGALGAVVVSGAVHARIGSACQLVGATVTISTGYLAIGLGPAFGSLPLLVVGVVVNGVGMALLSMAMNVESGRIERAFGRTIIPQFHAGFSAGAVLGSLLGALCAATGVPVGIQLPTVAVVGLVWRLVSVRAGLVLAPDGTSARALPERGAPAVPLLAPVNPWREHRTLAIGVVALAASFSEGAANNWLSLATVDSFARPEAVGALVLGMFIAAMLVVRALGTRLIDRFGRVAVLRTSGLTALSGLLLFGLAPVLHVAAVGVVAWGAGAGLAVPIAMSAASDEPTRAAHRVAVVSSFSTIATLVAPPLLGLAAESIGARHAMLAVAIALVASVAVAGRAAPLSGSAADASDQATATALVAAGGAVPARLG